MNRYQYWLLLTATAPPVLLFAALCAAICATRWFR